MNKQIARLVIALTFVMTSISAEAHSFLVRSTPTARERLTASPPRILLRFGGGIEANYSKITLIGNGERTLAEGATPSGPRELSLELPVLKPGQYEVRWRVLSFDGHIVEGQFKFDLKPR